MLAQNEQITYHACRKCGETKPETRFYFRKTKRNIWRGTLLHPCKDCRKGISREGMQRHYKAVKERFFNRLGAETPCPQCGQTDNWKLSFKTALAADLAKTTRMRPAFFSFFRLIDLDDLRTHVELVCKCKK